MDRFALLLVMGSVMSLSAEPRDPRWIETGVEIPSEGYCDQPYAVVMPDGAWVLVMTTGAGVEGQPGQHVVSLRSTDQGKTWSGPYDIEPADGPEASWALPLLTDFGRVYAFYTYNFENRREVLTVDRKPIKRVDSFGALGCKWSDDGGMTWSAERILIPIREFQCDRDNVYGGEVRFFWQVGKPISHDGVAWIGLSKVHGFGYGFFEGNEGIFLRSDNAMTERHPHKVVWETQPDGDIGLRSPGGPIASEHNLVALSDGSLYCTYRTIDGHPCHAYSRDGGHTWTPPAYMTYTPGGRLVKHPRAANFVKKASNGKYLYWFHNHGGKWYDDRNPAWLMGGVEHDGFIHWSQPEILLYDDDPRIRMSYPDFIEDGGKYFFTETQKEIARTHAIDPTLLEGLWRQSTWAEVARDGLVLELDADSCKPGAVADLPKLPSLGDGTGHAGTPRPDPRGGLSLDLWLQLEDLAAGQVLLDNRSGDGKGFVLGTTSSGSLEIALCDGRTTNSWDIDPGVVKAGVRHHVSVIVDGGPKLILFVVDGVLCDGGEARQFGWGRFSPYLREVNGGKLRIAADLHGRLDSVRIYSRAVRVSEAVGNWRAGL